MSCSLRHFENLIEFFEFAFQKLRTILIQVEACRHGGVLVCQTLTERVELDTRVRKTRNKQT